MVAILAIDAAWTPKHPSGVALLEQQNGAWKCLAVAPSYDDYIRQCHGELVEWDKSPKGAKPDADALLHASNAIINGERVELITIDMPVSQEIITGRRPADQAVSKAFGGQGCGTHSPNAKRPGSLGAGITQGFAHLGYRVATTGTPRAATMQLVEVYPHPALIRLLNAEQRVPYKVSKSNRYWPGTSIKERISRLLEVFTQIHNALSLSVRDLPLKLPAPFDVTKLSGLKRYEDALDALVCGWVGICYLAGRAVPFGDENAAIWIPDEHWSNV